MTPDITELMMGGIGFLQAIQIFQAAHINKKLDGKVNSEQCKERMGACANQRAEHEKSVDKDLRHTNRRLAIHKHVDGNGVTYPAGDGP